MQNFLQVQQMIANMDEDQMAEQLMQQHPNMDPAMVLAQPSAPAGGIVPGDANQPGQEINAGIDGGLPFASGSGPGTGGADVNMMLQALSGAQSGQQTGVQLPAPHLFGFGNAAPRKTMIDLPDAPGRFGNLMFGGK